MDMMTIYIARCLRDTIIQETLIADKFDWWYLDTKPKGKKTDMV